MICTAAASLSRRRLRSVAPLRSSRWVRSQSRRAGRLKCSRCAVSCNTCVRCAMSVIWRSPSSHDSTRVPIPPSCAASKTAATPRSRAWSAHSRRVSAIRSVNVSPSAARVSVVSPKNIVVAAARTSPERCGWSNASSRHSQSSAAGEPNTSESPVYTAGMPAAASASKHTRPSRWVSTITAMSPGLSGRSQKVAPLDSSAAMSEARSELMWVRSRSIVMTRSCLVRSVSRDTTRRRNGSLCGAPLSRCSLWLAATSRTTILASPSWASRITA